MELDLTGRLEQSEPAAMDLPAMVEESELGIGLELSLGWSSGEEGSRKRARESEDEVEEKKPKMEVDQVPYGLQIMPVMLMGPNGYYYAYMLPCWVPSSVDIVENSACEPTGSRSLALETDGVATGGLSSPGSSRSGTSVLQSFSAKGERSSINESRSHSNGATTDNTSSISAFRNSELGLKKKPPIPIKGRKKRALSRKVRAFVSTRSMEGKKIDGCLYQCSEHKVRIQCECHGSSFSPAGFVRHAGGPETQHPLKQITVVLSS